MNNNYRKFAPVVLRFGLVFVFGWFSINQFMDPEGWTRMIPEFVVNMTGLEAITIVKMNATFEIVMAILLAIGFKVRIVAFLLALHLLTIVIKLGLTPNGIRDIGLMLGALSVALQGNDMYTYEKDQII